MMNENTVVLIYSMFQIIFTNLLVLLIINQRLTNIDEVRTEQQTKFNPYKYVAYF